MTNRPALAALAALLTVGTVSQAAAQQQAGPSAETVASWVQTFYDQTQSMSARFTQRYHNRVYDQTTTSRGQVRFAKPGRMRFDYDEPNGKVIACDGDQLVVYEPPSGGQGRGQYYQQRVQQAQLPAAFSFLTGTGQLAPNYTFRRLHGMDTRQIHVLELRPRRPTPHYTRILLYVDRSDARRGVVHRVVIVDQAGNTNRFDFERQQLDQSIAASVFQYTPPRGARRVQP